MTTKGERVTDSTGNGANGASLDKLLTRGGGSVALLIMFWMNTTLSGLGTAVADLKTEVTKVTTELDIVSPKDVQISVNQMRGEMLTVGDLQTMAPWVADKPVFESRLSKAEEDIRDLRRLIEQFE